MSKNITSRKTITLLVLFLILTALTVFARAHFYATGKLATPQLQPPRSPQGVTTKEEPTSTTQEFTELLPDNAKDVHPLTVDLDGDGINELVATYNLPTGQTEPLGSDELLNGVISIWKKEGNAFTKIYENKKLAPHGDALEVELHPTIIRGENNTVGVFVDEYSVYADSGCHSDFFFWHGKRIVSLNPEQINAATAVKYGAQTPGAGAGMRGCLSSTNDHILSAIAIRLAPDDQPLITIRIEYEFTGNTIEPILVEQFTYDDQGNEHIEKVMYQK